MGLAGLVTWLAWTVSVTWGAWRIVRSLRRSPLFPMAFCILWYVFLLLFPMTFGGMQPYQNFVFNAFLWLLIGVLYRLPRLVTDEGVAAPERKGVGRASG